jgi:hypothetical protein
VELPWRRSDIQFYKLYKQYIHGFSRSNVRGRERVPHYWTLFRAIVPKTKFCCSILRPVARFHWFSSPPVRDSFSVSVITDPAFKFAGPTGDAGTRTSPVGGAGRPGRPALPRFQVLQVPPTRSPGRCHESPAPGPRFGQVEAAISVTVGPRGRLGPGP